VLPYCVLSGTVFSISPPFSHYPFPKNLPLQIYVPSVLTSIYSTSSLIFSHLTHNLFSPLSLQPFLTHFFLSPPAFCLLTLFCPAHHIASMKKRTWSLVPIPAWMAIEFPSLPPLHFNRICSNYPSFPPRLRRLFLLPSNFLGSTMTPLFI